MDDEPLDGNDPDAEVEEDASADDGTPDAATSACAGATTEQACIAFCEVICRGQEQFCGASECEPEECEAGGPIVQHCEEQCDDADCAQDLCEGAAELTCESFGIEVDGKFESYCLARDPRCVVAPELGCSDVCGSSEDQVGGDFADNGVCEDGSGDSVSSVCTRGSDCTDCGPQVCIEAGRECQSHGDCCGFYGPAGALCVDPDGQSRPMPSTCLLGCDADHPCPRGSLCNPTTGNTDVCVPI